MSALSIVQPIESFSSKINQVKMRKVKVRIWPKQISSLPTSWLSTGHVSLETFNDGPEEQKGIYVSFWPGVCIQSYDAKLEKPRTQNICKEACDHYHTLKEDRLIYGTEPPDDAVFEIYGLVLEEIEAAFDLFKNSRNNWSILGSGSLRGDTSNCCGLTYLLLRKGGLIDPFYQTQQRHRNLVVGVSIAFLTIALFSASSGYAVYKSIMSTNQLGKDLNKTMVGLRASQLLINSFGKTDFIEGISLTNRTLGELANKEKIDGNEKTYAALAVSMKINALIVFSFKIFSNFKTILATARQVKNLSIVVSIISGFCSIGGFYLSYRGYKFGRKTVTPESLKKLLMKTCQRKNSVDDFLPNTKSEKLSSKDLIKDGSFKQPYVNKNGTKKTWEQYENYDPLILS